MEVSLKFPRQQILPNGRVLVNVFANPSSMGGGEERERGREEKEKEKEVLLWPRHKELDKLLTLKNGKFHLYDLRSVFHPIDDKKCPKFPTPSKMLTTPLLSLLSFRFFIKVEREEGKRKRNTKLPN